MAKSLESVFMAAKRSAKRGDFDEAERLYEGVLLEFPKNVRAHKGLDELRVVRGNAVLLDGAPPTEETNALIALINSGRFQAAIDRGETLLLNYPRSLLLHDALGQSYYAIGRVERAADVFDCAVAIQPERAETHFNLGLMLQELGRNEEAIASYQSALKYKPDYAAAYNNLGALLCATGSYDEAISNLKNAIKLKADFTDAYNNLGNAFRGIGNHETAAAYYEHVLSLAPNHAKAHYNLGIIKNALGKKGEAIMCFERAIAHAPDYADPHREMANIFVDLELRDEAIASASRAITISPNDDNAFGLKVHQQAHICDWDSLSSEADRIATLGISGNFVNPWGMLSFEDAPERHRLRSERSIDLRFRKTERVIFSRPAARPDKLRIGYFSADFCRHATMVLLGRMLELHDRDRFEIHAFSYGEEDSSAYRHLFDRFHNVQAMNDGDLAALARKAEIDIAVDLKGHTKGGRLGIFAHGAAPIQISYLGYPGTTGAPFIDYMIADKMVIPDEQRQNYSERIIYLPDSYQVNDNCRVIPDQPLSRADVGLPKEGFVFCCFNSSYKITPEEFDIWMRLLVKIEGCVIWLLKGNKWVENNLRKEAEKRGIAGDRLIFAEPMSVQDHLARQQIADLFLDTFNVNAHTTASDALWAGLPVLTRLGKGFAARVAGSLLNAVELPELITATSEEYEALALELATNSEKLEAVRNRLAFNRLSAPLFNTELFTRRMEAAYDAAYDHFLNEQSMDIWVDA